ncbi:hypothetical protein QBC34DRAFT_388738 [Podospora aff. communis PSN243]|uniref:Uncharacterized protein n=1 Tax=Podospora aff. communis PSN243 TaxID=3040156 RepID=A0AAV9H5U6_9PEZI|nr:hypothetical protein QBC34DRAFT_388738 [Podospora aff. communis PSN243]
MASLLEINLSYYTIPAAFLVAFLPHAYASILAGKNYDLANPRKTLIHIEKDTSLSKPILRRIQRGEAASANGLETIGLYAAGVVAANVAGVPKNTLNAMTLGYVASRVVYNWVYVFAQDNSRVAPLRSLVWFVGVGLLGGLWVKAGNAVNV